MSARDEDLQLLREALEMELDGKTTKAFEDMLSILESVRGDELSEKQRAWVRRVVGEPVYENLASKDGTIVPRAVKHNHRELAECRSSCPAWAPPTLRDLPKRPPTRRAP